MLCTRISTTLRFSSSFTCYQARRLRTIGVSSLPLTAIYMCTRISTTLRFNSSLRFWNYKCETTSKERIWETTEWRLREDKTMQEQPKNIISLTSAWNESLQKYFGQHGMMKWVCCTLRSEGELATVSHLQFLPIHRFCGNYFCGDNKITLTIFTPTNFGGNILNGHVSSSLRWCEAIQSIKIERWAASARRQW